MAMVFWPRRERRWWGLFEWALIAVVVVFAIIGFFLDFARHPILGWLVSWFR